MERNMNEKLNRKVVLQDGAEFYGVGFGAECDRVSELVFNTAMAGYQDVLYDPASAAQIVLMTYPIIGNLGITDEEQDAKAPLVGGVIVRQLNEPVGSSASSLDSVLRENGIPAICEVDTRAITRKIRGKGKVYAVITDAVTSTEDAVKMIADSDKKSVGAGDVSTKAKRYFRTSTRKFSVVVVDCGVRLSYVRLLNKYGCNVTVVPWNASAEEILDMKPDGVFVSSGPGTTENCGAVVDTVRTLIGKAPVFGVGLGCEIIAAAYGIGCVQLQTGRRGCNHPVKNMITGSIAPVSRNCGCTLDASAIPASGLTVTHTDVIEGTPEGIADEARHVYAVMYYPENIAESADKDYMLEKFIASMKETKDNA